MVVGLRESARETGTVARIEVSGPPDAPAVLVLGGISADRHVCASPADLRGGWWEGVAGPGRALDAKTFRVIGCDFVDGGAAADGRPATIVTTHDQAACIARALDDAGIECLHAIVGASYGGMVALAFAETYPERVERLIIIGAAHRANPLTTAFRSVQRSIVEAGLDSGRAREAMVTARALATATYRSAREFAGRFDAAPSTTGERTATFPVERYLRHQGEKFAARFTPARFLALSLSTDLHAVNPAAIETPAVLVAAEGDMIVPRDDVDELARTIAGPVTVCEIAGVHGHDAFLTEPAQVSEIIAAGLLLPTFS